MYIECLQRHLAVCAMRDLPQIAKRDPKFWNVVSLLGPEAPTPARLGFRDQHRAFLNDVRATAAGTEMDLRIVDENTMRGILEFVDERQGQPILVHCVAGISRSPAAALVFILRGLVAAGAESPAEMGIDTLLQIRPQARPNPLVLRAGLLCFLPQTEADGLLSEVMADPRMTRDKRREGFDEE
ncbi:MAG TPA: hypothetical protein PLU30_00390 [Verrucomicrobiae bacterium]|nr:hypothetical protein [Verrucomicrobiae bacterium]